MEWRHFLTYLCNDPRIISYELVRKVRYVSSGHSEYWCGNWWHVELLRTRMLSSRRHATIWPADAGFVSQSTALTMCKLQQFCFIVWKSVIIRLQRILLPKNAIFRLWKSANLLSFIKFWQQSIFSHPLPVFVISSVFHYKWNLLESSNHFCRKQCQCSC